MEIKSVTYYGWRDHYQTVEKRITYDYSKGNDVVTVERRSFPVMLYAADGYTHTDSKGSQVDKKA